MENLTEPVSVSLEVCDGCKAEIRSGSEYCYNCGKKLHEAEIVDPIPVAPIPPTAQTNGVMKNGPGMGAAAANRKGQRARRRHAPTIEPVQVVYRRDESFGYSFILLSFAAAAFAIVLVVIAYYLR